MNSLSSALMHAVDSYLRSLHCLANVCRAPCVCLTGSGGYQGSQLRDIDAAAASRRVKAQRLMACKHQGVTMRESVRREERQQEI